MKIQEFENVLNKKKKDQHKLKAANQRERMKRQDIILRRKRINCKLFQHAEHPLTTKIPKSI